MSPIISTPQNALSHVKWNTEQRKNTRSDGEYHNKGPTYDNFDQRIYSTYMRKHTYRPSNDSQPIRIFLFGNSNAINTR